MDRGSDSLGSRKTAFNLLAAPAGTEGDLSRRVVVIKIEECTLEFLDRVLNEQKAGALLFIIPDNLDDFSEETISHWKSIEESLVERDLSIPVYFALASDDLKGLQSQITSRAGAASSTSEDFRLVVTASEAVKVSSVSMTNFQVMISLIRPVFESMK